METATHWLRVTKLSVQAWARWVTMPGLFNHLPRLMAMDLETLTAAMHAFVESKGWYQPDSLRPQTPRNLAISLMLEAGEVLELYQWSDAPRNPDALPGELADVLLYLLQIASINGIDLGQAVMDKLNVNYGRTWDEDVKNT
jgi:NTP pyrophosphatase (non-canonical NTP hydrolase)